MTRLCSVCARFTSSYITMDRQLLSAPLKVISYFRPMHSYTMGSHRSGQALHNISRMWAEGATDDASLTGYKDGNSLEMDTCNSALSYSCLSEICTGHTSRTPRDGIRNSWPDIAILLQRAH